MVDAHIVLALIEMAANQEFTDQGALGTVIAKFDEIHNNLSASLAQTISDEDASQVAFVADVKDCNRQINENELTISDNNDGLVENAKNTSENQNMLAMRKQDLVNFK